MNKFPEYKNGKFFGKEKFPKVISLHRRKDIERNFPFNKDTASVLTEKLDGANGRVYKTTTETGATVLVVLSRNTEVGRVYSPSEFSGDFRGFVPYVAERFNEFVETMEDGEIIYGEWLVPHTIKYPEEMYNNFYIFPNGIGKYPEIVETGSVLKAPIIEDNVQGFATYKELVEFMETELEKYKSAADHLVEGIVLVTENEEGFPPFRVKLVSDEFSETKKEKVNPSATIFKPEEYLTEATLNKRMLDVLNIMGIESPSHENAKEIMGRMIPIVWEDFIREHVVDNLADYKSSPKTVDLKTMKKMVGNLVADFLKGKGLF